MITITHNSAVSRIKNTVEPDAVGMILDSRPSPTRGAPKRGPSWNRHMPECYWC
jgi:hypothetical protein